MMRIKQYKVWNFELIKLKVSTIEDRVNEIAREGYSLVSMCMSDQYIVFTFEKETDVYSVGDPTSNIIGS